MSGHHHHGDESVTQRVALTSVCAVALLSGFLLPYFVEAPRLQHLLYVLSYLSGAWIAGGQAYEQLRAKQITVDVLMLVAAFGAYLVGEYPEGAFLLFLFSLSSTLETLILGRTRAAIEKLVHLNPTEATVRRDGVEKKVRVEEVLSGDRVLIRPGERVPVDGKILVGSSSLDQSPLTGESIPIDKTKGDQVLAGTLNLQGSLEVECQRKGEETTLARLVHLVEVAQTEKAESETVSRWFGQRYTIAVLILGALSFFVFFFFMNLDAGSAFYRAMTVLVVASPCAIVISVPAAILSAIANAARHGVLIKGGVYLERLATLKALAFDKTGTFTLGRPKVVGLFPVSAITEDELLHAAGMAELLSEHPLARAILREADLRGLSLIAAEELRSVVGKGVIAEGPGTRILLGKKALFEAEEIFLSEEVLNAVATSQSKGWTTMIVGRDDRALGSIAIADTLRPRAAETLIELRRLGLKRFIMLTGDNRTVAAEVARQLGSEFAADLLPEDKLLQLKQLRAGSGSVGMIGDGVNDAPSLAAADVGLSLGSSGSGVALEAADVVLMGDDLTKLTFAIRLAQKAQRIIWENLLFASGVMLVLLFLSFFRGIPMPIAVVGHEGSTVLVILNGLRLLWAQEEIGPQLPQEAEASK